MNEPEGVDTYEKELASLKGGLTKLGIPIPDETAIKEGGLRILQSNLAAAQTLDSYGINPKESHDEFQTFYKKMAEVPELPKLTFPDFVTACQGAIFYHNYEETGLIESSKMAYQRLFDVRLKPYLDEKSEKGIIHSSSLGILLRRMVRQGGPAGLERPDIKSMKPSKWNTKDDINRYILKYHNIWPPAIESAVKPFRTTSVCKQMMEKTAVIHTEGSPLTIQKKI